MLDNLIWIDYVFIAIIFVSILFGLISGFTRSILSIIAWVAALFIAFNFSDEVSILFIQYIPNDSVRYVSAFALLCVLVLLLFALIKFLMSDLMKKLHLGSVDRLFGLAFGGARGILIVAMGVLLLRMTPVGVSPYLKQSQIAQNIEPVITWLNQWVPKRAETVTQSDFSAAFMNFFTKSDKNNSPVAEAFIAEQLYSDMDLNKDIDPDNLLKMIKNSELSKMLSDKEMQNLTDLIKQRSVE